MTLFQFVADDGALLLLTAASTTEAVSLLNEASDKEIDEVTARKEVMGVELLLALHPFVKNGKPVWVASEHSINTYLNSEEADVTPNLVQCLGLRVIYENTHPLPDADEGGISEEDRATLLEQVRGLLPPTLAFDSNGHLHGLVGYTRAMKDPEHWEARGNPEGFWYNWGAWKAWLVEGNGPDVVDNWSFRRAANAPTLTHEELNA